MIIPLTFDEAQARWALYGIGEWPELWKPPSDGNPDRYHACRHWDTETRLCREYESRPTMCSGYPYGSACNAGCDFQVSPEEAAKWKPKEAKPEPFDWTGWRWDRKLRGYRVPASYVTDVEAAANNGWCWDADARIVYPAADGYRWSPARRKWLAEPATSGVSLAEPPH